MTKDQFMALIDKGPHPKGCWVWQGSISKERGGYGHAYFQKKMWRAHRLMHFFTTGTPTNKYVIHSCDNPPCVNPDHLRAGTQSDNMLDMHARGRHPSPGAPPGGKHPMAILTDNDVRAIHKDLLGGAAQQILAKQYGVEWHTISYIASGRTWTHLALPPIPRRIGSKRHGAKLTEKDIPVIRCRSANGETATSIAKDYNVGRTTIHDILTRKKWKHVPSTN